MTPSLSQDITKAHEHLTYLRSHIQRAAEWKRKDLAKMPTRCRHRFDEAMRDTEVDLDRVRLKLCKWDELAGPRSEQETSLHS